ncbi:putative MULE transposase domain, FHY3/FAR1 family [Helianthus annuus]|nr:putative MULE transposase domain, FHY3/FAR1 family [Helianthus annuus]
MVTRDCFGARFGTIPLRNSFVKSFERQPKVVVTDQDPAMKQAIESVFTTSRHRLCMWHIMKKVADKVGHELCNNEELKRKMCDIVWTYSIEPEVFKRQWKLVMIEFGLTQNKWIDDMFVMRSMWIPFCRFFVCSARNKKKLVSISSRHACFLRGVEVLHSSLTTPNQLTTCHRTSFHSKLVICEIEVRIA